MDGHYLVFVYKVDIFRDWSSNF